MNLLSSAQRKGKTVTQILINNTGAKKTYHGVKTETIEQGEFTKFDLEDGRMIMVNTPNTWVIEVHSEKEVDEQCEHKYMVTKSVEDGMFYKCKDCDIVGFNK